MKDAGHASLAREDRIVVPEADGLRGIAALLIVVYHCWVLADYAVLDDGPFRAILGSGYFAVDLFFVLSGFVLFLPVMRGTRLSVREYLRRRAARIMPAYYLSLVVVVAFNAWVATKPSELPQGSPRGIVALIAHALFLQQETYGISDQEGFGINTAVWTLSIEVIFYALLPLVARWYARHPVAGVALGLGVSAIWKVAVTHLDTWLVPLGVGVPRGEELVLLQIRLVEQFPTYAGHFALGMTAAWAFVRLRAVAPGPARRMAPLVQAAAVAWVLVAFAQAGSRGINGTAGPYDHFIRNTDLAIAFAALILASALAPRWWSWPLRNRAARWLGDVSYGTYLLHLPVIGFAITTLGFEPRRTDAAFLLLAAGVVPASILAGWTSRRLIEEPARRWARGRSADRRKPLRYPVVPAESVAGSGAAPK